MIGRVLKGKYKIYDQVGSGGFATVYLGRNMDTNEIVAIKVLSEQYTGEARYVERFRREASLAERLQHPNVVRILDHGIEDKKHFLVMEFVEGLTLDDILERRGQLPVDKVLSYAEQTCAGLQAAYRAGIIHRDVKPANLMITPSGTVKIMDFGIARMESMTALTQSGIFMGTPRYISPEMARGTGSDIRSDLYALGLLIYEMLAGTPPFDADNPWAVLRQQIEVDAPPIRQVRPDVPPWLEGIIIRAIAKDPTQRYQTPGEMLAALREQTPTPRHVPEAGPPPPAAATVLAPPARREKARPKGLIVGLVAAVVVVALALAALLAFGLGGSRATPTPTESGPIAQVSAAEPTSLPTNTARVVVVTSTPAPSQPTDTSPPPTDTAEPEPTSTVAPEPTHTAAPEPSNTAAPTVAPSDTAVPPTQGPTNTPAPTATATNPPPPAVSGKITFSAGGSLYIVDAATGQNVAAPLPGIGQPDLRADGAEIIANGQTGQWTSIVNINANNGAVIRSQTSFTDDFHPFWSPDGTRFTYDSLHHGLGNFTMLYTQGLTGGKPQPEVTIGYNGQQIRGHSPVWMHDDWIAFTGCDYWPGGTGGSKCGIYRIPSWGDRPFMVHAGSTDMRATDNHGGQLVFMSQEEGNWEVYVIANQGGSARNLSQSPSSQDGLATFSPNGQQVAFVSNRGGGWGVWTVKADGTGLAKLFNLPAAPTQPWYDDCMSWGP